MFPQGQAHMTCNAGCHVTYCSTYTTREPSIAPDCTGSNAKEHARWDLTSETAHHITSISRPLCSGHVMPTILRTYEKLGHALFPEVKSTNIEIDNRLAVDASLSLPEISHVQPGRVSYPPTHTATHIHAQLHDLILGPPPSPFSTCILVYPQAVV